MLVPILVALVGVAMAVLSTDCCDEKVVIVSMVQFCDTVIPA